MKNTLPTSESDILLVKIEMLMAGLFQGKRMTKRALRESSLDILFVALGIRSCTLIDRISISQNDLTTLIRQLRSKVGITSLVGIYLADTHMFIGRLQNLRDRVDKMILEGEKDCWFIDVSSGHEAKLLAHIPSSFLSALSSLAPKLLERSPELILSPLEDSTLVSLTGWLLDYPIVYVQETTNHSLANSQLTLTRVLLVPNTRNGEHLLISFSIPTQIFDSPSFLSLPNFQSWVQSRFIHRMPSHFNWHIRVQTSQVNTDVVL
ncbi:uncharacterized protein VTP21DRAFT_7024 [Calcarisporiella thermophila]|uniref:uncharacterized protein n=1 Tax=Calcarisporiella thermophila TaxID=911321 RepID=UPI0037421D08